MVSDKVVFFLQFCFLYTWMVGFRNCLILVLVVPGVICLLVHSMERQTRKNYVPTCSLPTLLWDTFSQTFYTSVSVNV